MNESLLSGAMIGFAFGVLTTQYATGSMPIALVAGLVFAVLGAAIACVDAGDSKRQQEDGSISTEE